MVDGGDPFYLKFWINLTPLEQNCRFSVHIRSHHLSGSTSRKCSIDTNRKSTARFAISLIWIS